MTPDTRPTVPWAFSEAVQPGEPSMPNARTPEGIALGRELARLCDVEEANQRERFPDMLPRCNDCAFRAGTLPNGCPETLMDAIKCVVESTPFFCHKGVVEGAEPKRLCTGAMVLTRPGSPLREFVAWRRRERNRRKRARREARQSR